MTATAKAVLDVARSQLGFREKPGNDTPFGTWYGLPGQSWCAMFVSWCADRAGATAIIPRHAWTPSGVQWFRSRGRWGTAPVVGALVYFDWPDSVRRVQHVGLVEAVHPDGTFTTIEGNTSGDDAGSQDNGDGVHRRRRSMRSVVGFGYPEYAAEATPAPARPVELPPTTPRPATVAPQRLTVDGELGPKTIAALQTALRVKVDGQFGPVTTRALQKRLGVRVDGVFGPASTRALQRHVGVPDDGVWGPKTTSALQRALNAGRF